MGSAAKRSSACAAARPTRSDNTPRPVVSAGRSMSVSQMPTPGEDCQLLPPLPRPAVCSLAITSVPAGAPSPAIRWATSSVDVVDSRSNTRGSSRTRSSSFASAPSNRATLPAGVEQPQDRDSERDSIESEDPIAMLPDVPHDNRDREPAADRRSDYARHDLIGEAPFSQCLWTFHHDRRDDDRHAHQKAELSGALPVEAEPAARGHRRTRA